MAIYSFKGFKPVIKSSSFIHPTASVIGDVHIGENVYIGPGAAIRGDWGTIVIEDGCNIQENCIIHMFPGITVTLHKGAHIGHGAVLHGVTIGENCLIGMNAVLMDEVVLEKECIVGALSFVKAKSVFKKRSLIVGNPAKKIKTIPDEMINWKTKGTKLYQQLPEDCKKTLFECEPLRKVEKDRPTQEKKFKTWGKS